MKKKHYLAALLLASVGLILTVTACSPSTFGQMSQKGQGIFSDYCRCHHSGGAGAPTLGKRLADIYQDAGQVYNKIRTQMPYDFPGLLAASEYQQVLSYILLGNGWVNAEDVFDVKTLSQITLGE